MEQTYDQWKATEPERSIEDEYPNFWIYDEEKDDVHCADCVCSANEDHAKSCRIAAHLRSET